MKWTILSIILLASPFFVIAQELTVSRVKQHADSLEIEISVKNTTREDILLVVPNPRDFTKTRYFLTLNEKIAELSIRRHFYEWPAEVVTGLKTQCFNFGKVKPSEIYKETLYIDYPDSSNYLSLDLKIDIAKVNSLKFELGVLPFDESITEIPNRKPFGRCVDGLEKISEGRFKGGTLLDVQNILRSDSAKK